MKLFTTTEVNTTKQKQVGLDIKRANTVNKVLNEKVKELQRVEAEFEVTISKQQIEWEKEKLEYVVSINTLKEEVKRLEERRRQALIPLDEQMKDIERGLITVELNKQTLKDEEQLYAERLELLEDKLSSVADRELEANRIDKVHKKVKLGIETQKELVSQQSRDLSSRMFNFKKEAEIRENDIKTVEASILLKEKTLKDKELELIKIEQSFSERERALQDKYATLERAIKEKI